MKKHFEFNEKKGSVEISPNVNETKTTIEWVVKAIVDGAIVAENIAADPDDVEALCIEYEKKVRGCLLGSNEPIKPNAWSRLRDNGYS